MKCQDVYGEPFVYQNDEKWLIRIFRPILTEEEEAKRMKRQHDAAADLIKDSMRAKARKERAN